MDGAQQQGEASSSHCASTANLGFLYPGRLTLDRQGERPGALPYPAKPACSPFSAFAVKCREGREEAEFCPGGRQEMT